MTPRTPATEALARIRSIAVAHVRAARVCEKPHRNGEANPHIHFGDSYIADARDLAWAADVLRDALATREAEARAPLDAEIERLREATKAMADHMDGKHDNDPSGCLVRDHLPTLRAALLEEPTP